MTARSVRVPGHFGELVQGRLGPSGPVALITLPCPALAVTADLLPGPFGLHQPTGRIMPLAEVRRMLAAVGAMPRGRVILRAGMPVGGGAGASTAARVALGRLAGLTAPEDLAALCLASEGASDPLMFPAPERLLWASRLGVVIDRLPPLPGLEILGGFYGPPRRTDPGDDRFADISDLIGSWRRAAGNAARLAEIASLSAARCLALRGPAGDPTADLAARHGALGWSVAHTGSARALIFTPGTVPDAAVTDLHRAGFSPITRFRIGEC